MEWIIFILAVVAYFMIGGFINGLFDMDMDAVVILWPLALIFLAVTWLVDIADDVGSAIREMFE